MHIGISRLELHVPMAQNLKDKRQVSRSLSARIRNKFNVAVAEEPDDDRWQMLTLVICCASSDIGHAHQMLSKVLDFVEDTRRDLEVTDVVTEIVSGV